MLLNNTVLIKWQHKNRKFYENKGYIFSGYANVFKVKIEDLPNGTQVKVDVQCDGCEKVLKQIAWNSYLKCVKEDGKYYCQKCAINKYKKYTSFFDWCYDNLPKEEADNIISRWDYELNIDNNRNKLIPQSVSFSSLGLNKKGYWFKCLDHPEHGAEQKRISGFTQGKKGSITCNQCNTISITHPHLVKYLVNTEDLYKYSSGSNKEIKVKCLNCGHEKQMSVCNFVNQGVTCPKCSDKVPYSEKFMFNLLEQTLVKNFEVRISSKILNWCKDYKYDNYIAEIKCIIETHGMQHYEQSKGNWITPLLDTQENDKAKEQLAKENGIKHYIIIDCKHSNMEWIKKSIMQSILPSLLNFKEGDIDWTKCDEYACNSLVKFACDLWESGIRNVQEIGNKIKLNKATVSRYLKQGAELEWCDYDPKKEQFRGRKIICTSTGDVFNSIEEASIKYGIESTTIGACCGKGRVKSAGRHPETGEPLRWMYYEEYINGVILPDYKNNKPKKVICITTNETFDEIKIASKKYNIDATNICSCCKGKYKSAGKHPITDEKLVWMYFDEYIIKTESEISNTIIRANIKSNPQRKKIICLTTNEIFNSINEAAKKYKIKSNAIGRNCNKKGKSAGTHPLTGDKLVWMLYEDYTKGL